MRKLILAAALGLFAASASPQTPPPPPKLLVVISVDQFSADLFTEYQPVFTGGFARLASGTVFPNAAATPGSGALGSLIKAQSPASRDVSISGSAAAPAQGWHWTGARFETDLAGAAVPRVVPKINAAIASALAQPRPPLDPPPFCQARARPGAKDGMLARAAGDSGAFAASPELDGDTLALAAGLLDEMNLGRGAAPDLLTIRLAAAGNVARAYGSGSEQMCLELIDLDREIGDFLSLLDSRKIDYAVSLDGISDQRVPMLFWRRGAVAATVDRPVDTSDIAPTLAATIGLPVVAAATEGHCLPEVEGADCRR